MIKGKAASTTPTKSFWTYYSRVTFSDNSIPEPTYKEKIMGYKQKHGRTSSAIITLRNRENHFRKTGHIKNRPSAGAWNGFRSAGLSNLLRVSSRF